MSVHTATLTPPPKKLGVTYWSTWQLAALLGLGGWPTRAARGCPEPYPNHDVCGGLHIGGSAGLNNDPVRDGLVSTSPGPALTRSLRLAARASRIGAPVAIRGGRLDEGQLDAVATLAGSHQLAVVEGAAGAGKTATLAATRAVVERQGRRIVVVKPTLKAAQVAAGEVGAKAFSAAWLATQHGFTWDEHGHWTRKASDPSPDAQLRAGDLLIKRVADQLRILTELCP